MWWLLAMACAWASVDDFVASVDAAPVVLMQCDAADRVVRPMGAGSALGLDLFARIAEGGQKELFDHSGPLYLGIFQGDALDLRVEAAVTDPAALDTLLADPALAESLEGAEFSRRGDRMQVRIPQEGVFTASDVSLLDALHQSPDQGCTVAVDVAAVLGGGQPPVSLMKGATVVTVTFEHPRGVHTARILGAQPSEVALEVLRRESGPGYAGATSTVSFPLSIQFHAPVDLALRALAELMDESTGRTMNAMVDQIPARFVGEDGVQIALGVGDMGGALVVPMRKPRSAGRLLEVARKVGRAAGGEVELVDKNLLHITIAGRQPLSVGVKKGLLVVAMREDVVRDVLAGEGEPWLPPVEGPYGVRMRSEPGFLPFLPGLDGYVLIGYEDGDPGALVLEIRPPTVE